MRDAAVAVALVLGLAAAAGADEVSLVTGSGRVDLAETTKREIAALVSRDAESCSLSSSVYPTMFRDGDREVVWRAVEARPHLYVRYDTPIAMPRGARGATPGRASEVLIAIDDPNFIGQPMTRHDGVVTIHAKCSGQVAVELMCLPELRPSFPETTRRNCHLVERWRSRQP